MAQPRIEEFEERLKINRDDLDTELSEQPELYYHVAEMAARARNRQDSMKDDLRRIDAEVAQEIRSRADAEGEKVTEGKILERVLSHEQSINARAQYREMCDEASRWSALQAAFEQRSYALKDLTNLFTTMHFNTDSASAPQRTVEERAEAARTALHQERTRRRELKP